MKWNLLVLVFTALAMFILATVVIGVLARAYAKYEDRYLAKQITDLSEMFFFIDMKQLILLTCAVTALAASTGFLLFGPISTVLLTIAGACFPSLLVSFYRARRVRLFDRQLLDALIGMASAFRAGMTLYQAMEEISRHSRPPLSQEFALTVREMRLGTVSDEALGNLAERVPSEALDIVVTAAITARTLGGNMADMFDTIAHTLRERFRIEGRVRALTAQGKLQGIVMGAMPLLVWWAFDWVRPDLTRPMMHHVFGYAVLALVMVMELLGAWFLRRIIAVRI